MDNFIPWRMFIQPAFTNNCMKAVTCSMRNSLALAIAGFVVLLCLAAPAAKAQLSPFSLGLQAGVSYSGWNLALVGQCHLRDFSAYLGPSMSLNRGLPGKGPIGINTGLNYHLPSKLDWLNSLVNLDYQLHFFNAAGQKSTVIHEFHLAYGLEFHVTESFSIVQTLGYGGYIESNPATTLGGERRNFSGYGGLVRLKAGYHF